jgi:hypothetical protein
MPRPHHPVEQLSFPRDCQAEATLSSDLPHGANNNQELVKQGWCWWCRNKEPGNTVLEGLEREGRGCGTNWHPPPLDLSKGEAWRDP